MAQIEPFQAYYYNPDKVPLEQVVTEPYDKIDKAAYERYSKRNSWTAAKLILNPEWPVDADIKGKYDQTNELFQQWISDRIVVRIDKPSFYIYKQTFSYNDKEYARIGLSVLCKTEPYENHVILPHEFTLSKPKLDRMEHLKTFKANFGHIFCLYSDKESVLFSHLKSYMERVPLFDFVDMDYSVRHQVWVIQEPDVIQKIQSFMRDKQLLIADGHHRYETALQYAQDGGQPYVMMTLLNLYDPGLVILPTHRALTNISDINLLNIVDRLRDDFHIERLSLESIHDRRMVMNRLIEAGKHSVSFGFYYGSNEFILLKYKKEAIPNTLFTEFKSATWRSLDVVILHKAILENYFGINEDKLKKETHVTYIRQYESAFDLVDRGGTPVVFFLNKTDVEKVFEVCKSGERMPQKSTDFYPKLLTGLLIYKF